MCQGHSHQPILCLDSFIHGRLCSGIYWKYPNTGAFGKGHDGLRKTVHVVFNLDSFLSLSTILHECGPRQISERL